jgi:uncharacterized protein (TIGR03083 family)
MSGRDNIAALRRSHDELAAQVHRLEAGTLNKQSGARDWTVADVLGHLGSGAEIGLATVQSGAVDQDAMPEVWGRWNAMSPAEKAASFVVADAKFVETYEAFDDDALTNRSVDMGFLPAPIPLATASLFRLSEHALHSWDVYVAFNPTAGVADYAVPLLLEQTTMMAGFVGRPLGRDAMLNIETTAPARQFALTLGESTQLTTGAATTDNKLTLPAEALLRMTAGRLGPEHTPSSVTIVGDVTLDDLRKVFPGY